MYSFGRNNRNVFIIVIQRTVILIKSQFSLQSDGGQVSSFKWSRISISIFWQVPYNFNYTKQRESIQARDISLTYE